MKLVSILCGIFVLLIFASPVHALFDPRSVSNNKFGMHVIDENDLEDAAKLVNSSGGDWGYVKIVIREDDRNVERWQQIFDKMRRLHLIPIVRLATKVEDDYWVKPRVEDIGSWVDFLNQLNWVIENRYVVVFNEPNHAKEWGHEIDPGEYGWYLKEFSRRLKEKSPDFFILPAGLDASAPDGAGFMDEATFISKMLEKEPDVLDFIDGWSSHSYPNPGFVSSPFGQGKGSVATFRWEQNLLSKYNKGNLPIFILETGWVHSDGKKINTSYPRPEQVATFYAQAFQGVWSSPDIVAVVPFLLNYQDAPFDHFSWKKIGTQEFYPMFAKVAELAKFKAQPKQKHAATIIKSAFPEKMVINSSYSLSVDIENTGQSIISGDDGWKLVVEGLGKDVRFTLSDITAAEPFHRTRVEVDIKTPALTARYTYKFVLKKDEQVIAEYPLQLALVPPPSLLVQARVWFRQLAEGSDFSLLLYNDDEKLLYEQKNILFTKGLADVENLYNIFPDQKYRLVLTKPYYLPRQINVRVSETKTGITFPPLLPFDPSNDGKLSAEDIGGFLKRPLETFGLLMAL